MSESDPGVSICYKAAPMAVYTEVSDTELEAFLAAYDIGALLSFKGIAEGVENSNYALHTERGSFILTLYEKRVAEADLPYFLGFMEHLAARGVACPTPVKARDGAALRRLKGKPAAIVTFLEGVWVRRPKLQHCAGLGRALAEMHRAGADYARVRDNALGPKGWRKLVSACGNRADELRPGLTAELASEMEALEGAWPTDLPTGHIHADLFPDNVFFVRDKLSGLIDFYFACHDFLAYDIAVCLNSWCFEARRPVQHHERARAHQCLCASAALDGARARDPAFARAGCRVPLSAHAAL